MKSTTSIHWSRFKENRYLTDSIHKLKNFRNNKLSIGLDDYINKEYGEKLFNELKNELSLDYILNFYNNKNIGNSKSFIKSGNKIIHFSHLFFIKWLSIIEEFIDFKKDINLICEIGGGYGALVEKILLKYKAKAILIDLELTNQLSLFYLKNNFPNLRIKSFSKNDINIFTLSELEKLDIAILTPDIEIENELKINLIINSRSFAEMEYETIKDYFSFIEKNIKDNGFLLNINRYMKKSVGYNISFFRYPYGKNWQTIYSNSSWHQENIHFLLTKKSLKKDSDIKQTLSEIKKITKIKRKEAFKEFVNKLPNNIYKKMILISIELLFNIIESFFPYNIYMHLSKIKYSLMSKKS